MAATFKFVSDAVDKNLFEVTGFKGEDGLSQLYRYEVQVKALTSRVNDMLEEKGLENFLLEVLEHNARLITEEGEVQYPVHGMLASFEENQTAGDYTYYTAVLVPRLWKLSIYRTNEIYTTEKTVDQIIETIMDQFDLIDGRDYFMSLSAQLLSRDYVCQFRETDFDFISRLMENEGIYYYFEQGESAEKLMIVDGADYPELEKSGVVFDVNAQALRRHESLFSWSCRTSRLPTHVSIRDYNPEQPSLDVHGTVDVETLSDTSGSGELTEYLYGDHFSNEEEAARLALLRAEEISCRKTRFYGEGAVCGFRPGYTFKMGKHPNKNYNGRAYLILEVSHEGRGLDSKSDTRETKEKGPQYKNTFVAIENHLSFRPPLTTKKPRFFGTMTAFVYAEAATGRAEVDEQGRYRVHLPFDRADGGKESSDANRKASCWVRMAQPFVGENEGMYFPLKGGTEVLLTFINGDPDRPIISSALPNASTPSLLTDQSSTESIIQTGANNKIRMEDKPGSERIIMESPTANSWVRIGAPNDPPNPHNVWIDENISSISDTTGTWNLVGSGGIAIPSKIVSASDNGTSVTYRLTKTFEVEKKGNAYEVKTPKTTLTGNPPALDSTHTIDGHDWKIGAVASLTDGNSTNVSFYREQTVGLQVKDTIQDQDPGNGVRIQTTDNIWLEAKNRYADYKTSVPGRGNTLTPPPDIQYLVNKMKNYVDFKPTGMQPYSYPSTETDPLANIPSDTAANQQSRWDYMVEYGRVTIAKGDTFNTQEGNIYDFGGYWNYNLGNAYVETHIDQKAVLNAKHLGDCTDPWSKLKTCFDGDVIAGPGSGAIATNFNKVSMHMDSAWVEKSFGDSYGYSEGNTLEISKGNTESHSKGNTYEYSYGGRSEETKFTGSGLKTFESWSESGEGSETTYDRRNGTITSYKYKNINDWFTYEANLGNLPIFNLSTNANYSISLSASASGNINIDVTLLGLSFDFKTGAAFGIEMDARVGGNITLKQGPKFEFEGLGFNGRRAASVEAEKKNLRLENMETWLRINSFELSKHQLALKKHGVLIVQALTMHT